MRALDLHEDGLPLHCHVVINANGGLEHDPHMPDIGGFGCSVPRPPLECHSFHYCARARLTSTRKTNSIFDVGEACHAQVCSSRKRRIRRRSHIRASKTAARDGPFIARGRELREQKARSSDCYSRIAENDSYQGVMSAGRSPRRVALASAWSLCHTCWWKRPKSRCASTRNGAVSISTWRCGEGGRRAFALEFIQRL